MRFDEANSPFTILGLQLDCGDNEVREAYRRKAMLWHPDRNPSAAAEEEFKRIQLAYQLVRTEANRESLRRIMGVGRRPPPGPRPGPTARHAGPPPRPAGPAATDLGSSQYQHEDHARVRTPSQLDFHEYLLAVCHHLLLRTRMRLVFYRVPLQAGIACVLAFVLLNWQVDGTPSPVLVGQALGLGLVMGFLADSVIDYLRYANRYHLRVTLNNLVGVAALVAGVGLALSFETSVGALLPSLTGIDGATLRTLLWLLLGSAVYAWLVFCFLFNRSLMAYEIVLVWLWVAGVEVVVLARLA